MVHRINLSTYYLKKQEIEDAFGEASAQAIKDSIDGKVNISDIKDNLTSTDTNKPLSAKQGKELKTLVDGKAASSHTHTKSEISDFPSTMTPSSHTHGNLQNDGSVGSSNNASKNVVTDANGKITTEAKPTIPTGSSTATDIKMDGTQSAGTSSNFAKADHVHPTDTSRAPASHTHTKSEVSDFAHTHDDRYYTETEMDTKLSNKSKVSFTQTKTSGIEIGTINIDGTDTKIYQQDNNTTYTAATATPKMDGTGTVGTSDKYAREDHIHPADTSKTVTLSKLATATTGYVATYEIKQGGTSLGKIDIPKDYLVKSGSVKTVSTANSPVSGYAVGDKYIDFVINTKTSDGTDEHIYVNVKDLIDTYTIATTSADGLMSAADKTKLNGIATGANNYSHPSTHAATMITDATAHGTIGSSANATQADINTKIDTKISNIVTGNVDLSGTHTHTKSQISDLTTVIENGTDLNTITTIGFYAQPSTAATSNMTNIPVKKAFTMIVEPFTDGGVTQTISFWQTNQKFVRTGISGNWYAWKEIAFKEQIDPLVNRYNGKFISGVETVNKPFLRLFNLKSSEGNSSSGHLIFEIIGNNNDRLYAKIRVDLRQDNSTTSTYSVTPLEVYGINLNELYFALHKNGLKTNLDIYRKVTSWVNFYIRIYDDHLRNGSYTMYSPVVNSTESYTDLSSAATTLYGSAYASSSQGGTYAEASNTLPYTNLTANKFVKRGGTSSQFLKADGSVDGTTYVATGDSRLSDTRTPKFNNNIEATSSSPKNLNTYRTGGFYYCCCDANNAPYVSNCPLTGTNNKSFFLLVETWGAGDNNSYVKQTLTYYHNNNTYIRVKTGNSNADTGWTKWKLLGNSTAEYIVGTQTASTSTWTGTSNDIYSLAAGQVIYYKLPYASTSTAVTLNLTLADGTTTGAKEVWFWNGGRLTTHYGVNSVIGLIYNGSQWWVINPSSNNTNNVLNGANYFTTGEALTTNNLIACKKADGKYYKINTLKGLVIDISKPVLIANGSLNADQKTGNSIIYHPWISPTNLNGGTTLTLSSTTHQPVYLEGTGYSNGEFTVSTTPITQTLTNGRFYIMLGVAYATNGMGIDLTNQQVLYCYNGALVPSTSWNSLVNKPSSFTPSSHTHTKSQITDFPTSMTPTAHASTATTYGGGTASNYGHVKVSDNYTSSAGNASQSVAASSAAVKSVYDIANGKPSLGTTSTTAAKGDHTHDYSKVSVSPTKTSGVEIGRITVDGTEKILYQQDNNTTYTAESTATNIKMNGTQAVGSLSTYARGDHVHPSDTSRVAVAQGSGNANKTLSTDGSGNVTVENKNNHSHYDNQISYSASLAGAVTPIDLAAYEEFNANRLAFLPPANITIKYSTTGATGTWTDYGASNADKTKLVSLNDTSKYPSFLAGKGATASTNNALQIILDAGYNTTNGSNVYVAAKKMFIYFSTGGATGCKCQIDVAYYNAQTTFTQLGTWNMSGYSGWNSIPFNKNFGGMGSQMSSADRVRYICLTFWNTTGNYNFAVRAIKMIGENAWIFPSNLSVSNHMYTYDENQNVTFPAKIIKSGGTSSQFLKADGSVDSNTYSTTSHTHNYLPTNANGTTTGTLTATKFINSSSNNTNILLGNGNTLAQSTFATSGHTHDYSGTYAPKTHTHASSDVTGLTASLNVVTDANGKLSTETKNNHTHSYIPSNADGTTTGNLTATTSGKGVITANKFIMNGGTSGHFLKVDGTTAAANNYSHPTNLPVLSSGLYKITTNNNGHITAGTAVTSTDIANLGVKITDNNTTYTNGNGINLSGTTFSAKFEDTEATIANIGPSSGVGSANTVARGDHTHAFPSIRKKIGPYTWKGIDVNFYSDEIFCYLTVGGTTTSSVGTALELGTIASILSDYLPTKPVGTIVHPNIHVRLTTDGKVTLHSHSSTTGTATIGGELMYPKKSRYPS